MNRTSEQIVRYAAPPANRRPLRGWVSAVDADGNPSVLTGPFYWVRLGAWGASIEDPLPIETEGAIVRAYNIREHLSQSHKLQAGHRCQVYPTADAAGNRIYIIDTLSRSIHYFMGGPYSAIASTRQGAGWQRWRCGQSLEHDRLDLEPTDFEMAFQQTYAEWAADPEDERERYIGSRGLSNWPDPLPSGTPVAVFKSTPGVGRNWSIELTGAQLGGCYELIEYDGDLYALGAPGDVIVGFNAWKKTGSGWTAIGWRSTGVFAEPNAPQGTIFGAKVFAGRLIVWGQFDDFEASTVSRSVKAWDGSAWSQVAAPGFVNDTGTLGASLVGAKCGTIGDLGDGRGDLLFLGPDSGCVAFGGVEYDNVGGSPRGGIWALDRNLNPLRVGPGLPAGLGVANVQCLEFHTTGGRPKLFGASASTTGGALGRPLWSFDGVAFRAEGQQLLRTQFASTFQATVNDMVSLGEDLCIVGTFDRRDRFDGVPPLLRIAFVSRDAELQQYGDGLDGRTYDTIEYRGERYAAGNMKYSPDRLRAVRNFAWLDRSDDLWKEPGGAVNQPLRRLCEFDGYLISVGANGWIARTDDPTAAWDSFTTADDDLNGCAEFDGDLYVWGRAQRIGGGVRPGLARLGAFGEAWEGLLSECGFEGGRGEILDCRVAGGVAWIAGRFDIINGVPVSNVAAVTLATGAVDDLDGGLDGRVEAIELFADYVWAIGEFPGPGGGDDYFARYPIAGGSWDSSLSGIYLSEPGRGLGIANFGRGDALLIDCYGATAAFSSNKQRIFFTTDGNAFEDLTADRDIVGHIYRFRPAADAFDICGDFIEGGTAGVDYIAALQGVALYRDGIVRRMPDCAFGTNPFLSVLPLGGVDVRAAIAIDDGLDGPGRTIHFLDVGAYTSRRYCQRVSLIDDRGQHPLQGGCIGAANVSFTGSVYAVIPYPGRNWYIVVGNFATSRNVRIDADAPSDVETQVATKSVAIWDGKYLRRPGGVGFEGDAGSAPLAGNVQGSCLYGDTIIISSAAGVEFGACTAGEWLAGTVAWTLDTTLQYPASYFYKILVWNGLAYLFGDSYYSGETITSVNGKNILTWNGSAFAASMIEPTISLMLGACLGRVNDRETIIACGTSQVHPIDATPAIAPIWYLSGGAWSPYPTAAAFGAGGETVSHVCYIESPTVGGILVATAGGGTFSVDGVFGGAWAHIQATDTWVKIADTDFLTGVYACHPDPRAAGRVVFACNNPDDIQDANQFAWTYENGVEVDFEIGANSPTFYAGLEVVDPTNPPA